MLQNLQQLPPTEKHINVDYDPKSAESIRFFQTVQNKLHYAAHAELRRISRITAWTATAWRQISSRFMRCLDPRPRGRCYKFMGQVSDTPQMAYVFQGFFKAWQILDNMYTPDIYLKPIIFPWLAYGAFACELGLKRILATSGIVSNNTHLLHLLIEKLPVEMQTRIWNEIREKHSAQSEEEVVNRILMLSNAFENYRYAYENCQRIDCGMARDLFWAILKEALKLPMYDLTECEVTKEAYIRANEVERKAIGSNYEKLKRKDRRIK